jgi:hypothetical protein
MPRMRVDNSPSAPFILGLGTESAGGHAVVAGVQTGGHPVALGRAPVVQSVPRSPNTGFVGGGEGALGSGGAAGL